MISGSDWVHCNLREVWLTFAPAGDDLFAAKAGMLLLQHATLPTNAFSVAVSLPAKV